MMQSAGALIFSSMVMLPISSATMSPEVGFLMFVTFPLMSAFSVEYSNIRSQSSPKVQFSMLDDEVVCIAEHLFARDVAVYQS